MVNIGIITPGGDAPGVNACLRALVRRGIASGMDVYGIYHGYAGLLEEKIVPLTSRSVSGIVQQGGSILKSTRCKEIKQEKNIKKAVEILKRYNIHYTVIVGGDGSLMAGYRMHKYGLPVIGIPASIDNDVYGTDESIGFDTAIDTAIEAIDKIRDTAVSFERIFVIEVMGREHGFLAVSIGLASGAEFVVIPEIKIDINNICKKLLKQKAAGKTSGIIIFAEGSGNVVEFANEIEKHTGIEVRVSSLGYIQRGGNPSARSRILGTLFGSYAIDLIRKGYKNCVVVSQKGQITHLPLLKVVSNEKKITTSLYNLVEKIAI